MQLHISHSSDHLRDQVVQVRNDEVCSYLKKPMHGTGLWTSTWRAKQKDSAWVAWCHHNDFGDPFKAFWYLLTPKPETRVYTIRGRAELAALIKNYPHYDERLDRLSDGLNSASRLLLTGIDFERLSLDYDGLRLTQEGNDALHLDLDYNMNAWDSESTLWFRWIFSEVRRVRTRALAETQLL